jgi:hypothetical protein
VPSGDHGRSNTSHRPAHGAVKLARHRLIAQEKLARLREFDPTVEGVQSRQLRCHLSPIQTDEDRSQPGLTGQDRSSEVRDLPRNGERVTGVEQATLCLASVPAAVATSSHVTRR